MSDPRTDFFGAGNDTPEDTGDARTAFFSNADSDDSEASKPKGVAEPVYDAAEFKRRVGRDPEGAELVQGYRLGL